MDSHTPLIAAEIARRLTEQMPSPSEHLTITCDEASVIIDLLTPPTDAALREAVEKAQQGLCVPTLNPDNPYCAVDKMAVRTLIRAVQAPRLTGEQMEAVRNVIRKTESRQCICGDGYLCARCEILGDVCAAFPGVCE